MLLVRDSMAREIATLSPDETAATALALCRERRIRHLPVLKEARLVGIVSDRDLRSSTPALGDPDHPIEQAANTMRERKIGCLPVLEGEELVGIITASDVMEALVYLVGAH